MPQLKNIMLITASLLSLPFSRTVAAAGIMDTLDDATITSLVSSALIMDRRVSTREISVETYQNQVMLCGWAENKKQKDTALAIAKDVKGVKKVYDALDIKPKEKKDESWREHAEDSILAARVKTQLINTHGVPAGKINVVSYAGEVQLCGFIDNKKIAEKAVKTVEKMDDVKVVHNKLVILDNKTK